MKVKGISFFELHAEKIVLGVAVLLLLGVVGWQVLGGSAGVRIDNREVAAGEVNAVLRQRAESLAGRLRADAPPTVQLFEGEPPLVRGRFESALQSGGAVTSIPRDRPALAAALLPRDIAEVAWYYEPRFEAVAIDSVAQTSDALLEESWRSLGPLGGRFASSATSLDVTWLTPTARIDLAGLRRELARSRPRDTPARIAVPPLWFNERLLIVDVVFERQRRGSDGWGAVETVAAFPTQDSFRAMLADADAGLRDEVFDELARASRQLAILQPEFVATRNDLFMSPAIEAQLASSTPTVAGTPADEEVRRLRRQLQRLRQDLTRTQARLDELGGPLRDDEPRGDRPGGRGRSSDDAGGMGGAAPPRGGGLGAGSGMSGRRGEGTMDEATRRQRSALTERVARLSTEVSRTEAEIGRLAPGSVVADAGGSSMPDVMRDESLLAWTHDLEVEPDSTYRYRARVEVYNPFFARTNQLVVEQQSLADPFTLASAVGPWSEPVTVAPPVSFFVTRATPGDGALGLGSATVEVFAFRDGRRQVQSFSVSPGDPIGRRTEARRAERGAGEVDFSTGWFVIDVVEDPARDRVTAGDRARGVTVLVGRMDSPEVIEIRIPEEDSGHPERRRFEDEVRSSRGT